MTSPDTMSIAQMLFSTITLGFSLCIAAGAYARLKEAGISLLVLGKFCCAGLCLALFGLCDDHGMMALSSAKESSVILLLKWGVVPAFAAGIMAGHWSRIRK